MKKITKYQKVPHTLHSLKAQLAKNNPIAFGFAVFESFESDELAETGIMQIPNVEKESMIGGHAVSIFGYNDETETFIVRNSWGPAWGDKGYMHVPYAFILDKDFCDDFWTLSQVP